MRIILQFRLNNPDTILLEITGLAYGGRGIAKLDGRIIFVENALPGDTVIARIVRRRKSYLEATTIDVKIPSPFRHAPACSHFGVCGGCRWQNYAYSQQLAYKSEQLKSQLIHIAGIVDPPIEPPLGARKIFYYRNKMEFSFNAGPNGDILLGLHRAGSYHDIFQLDKCHLQSELSNEIVAHVRLECHRLALPAYDIIKGSGFMRFLIIREGKFTSEAMVVLVTSADIDQHQHKLVGLCYSIAEKFSSVSSVFWMINSKKANIARWDRYPDNYHNGLVYGKDHIFETLGGYRFRISPDSFFQTNSYQAQILYDTVLEYAAPQKNDKLLDLYCGTGTIAIFLAGSGAEVIGVESEGKAIEDARLNAAENGIGNVKFIHAPVEQFIAAPTPADIVVVDPPRAGLHPRALKGVINLAPRRLVYVSCNPSTLARDVAKLVENGYHLNRTVAVDMFPHTYHIESVTLLIKE